MAKAHSLKVLSRPAEAVAEPTEQAVAADIQEEAAQVLLLLDIEVEAND